MGLVNLNKIYHINQLVSLSCIPFSSIHCFSDLKTSFFITNCPSNFQHLRVNYDKENWKKISNLLQQNHSAIHRTNRAQILDDSFALARAGHLEYPIALETTEYLQQEVDYIPWSAALKSFSYIGRMLARTSDCGEHKRFVKRQLMPLYGNVGFIGKSTEGSMVPRLRKEMVKTTCQLGYPDCVERSAQLFKEWRNSKCKKEFQKKI